jgi:hypothetical protein
MLAISDLPTGLGLSMVAWTKPQVAGSTGTTSLGLRPQSAMALNLHERRYRYLGPANCRTISLLQTCFQLARVISTNWPGNGLRIAQP